MRSQLSSIVAVSVLASFALPLQAATVSYFLDQSNVEAAFPDLAANYLRVDITDAYDASGDVRFDVTILDPRLLTGTGSGIQRFGFNVAQGAQAITAANIVRPSNWDIATDTNVDGFGNFELVADTTGQYRLTPTLTFFITGVVGDDRNSYVALATTNNGGTPAQGPNYFAAHVAGFLGVFGSDGSVVTSGYFGGQTLAVVPLPVTFWLLLSGIGLLVRGRRQRTHTDNAAPPPGVTIA